MRAAVDGRRAEAPPNKGPKALRVRDSCSDPDGEVRDGTKLARDLALAWKDLVRDRPVAPEGDPVIAFRNLLPKASSWRVELLRDRAEDEERTDNDDDDRLGTCDDGCAKVLLLSYAVTSENAGE